MGMKSKLDSRNDKRWGQNFVCGGMDYDRTGGKVNPASSITRATGKPWTTTTPTACGLVITALGDTAKKIRTTLGAPILAVTSTSSGRCVALPGKFRWTSSDLRSTRQILSRTVCDRTPRRVEAS